SRSVTSILLAYCSSSFAWTAVLAAAKAGVTATAPVRSARPPATGAAGAAGAAAACRLDGGGADAVGGGATGAAGAPLLGGAAGGGATAGAPGAPVVDRC